MINTDITIVHWRNQTIKSMASTIVNKNNLYKAEVDKILGQQQSPIE